MSSSAALSGYSIAVDFRNSAKSTAENVRAFITFSEVSENVYADMDKQSIIDRLTILLNESIPVYLNCNRLETDSDTFTSYGKKIASALQGNAAMKGVKVLCRLRTEHEKMADFPATSIASGYGKVLARSTDTKDFYRWVSWCVVFPVAKRAKDAFDALPFEGSTRADSDNAYPLAAAPALLGTERAISQDSALKDAVQAAQLATIAAKNDVRLSIRSLRTDRTIAELKDAANTMLAENISLKAENAYLRNMVAQMKAKAAPKAAPKAKAKAAPKTTA
jgi:hypothetical protein